MRPCPECGKDTVQAVHEPFSSPLLYEGRTLIATLPDALLWKCSNCGEFTIPNVTLDRLEAEWNRQKA